MIFFYYHHGNNNMANSITFLTASAVAATSIYLIYFICQIQQRGQTPTLIDLILLEFSKHNLNRFYFILTFQMWFDLIWIEFSLLCSSCCYCCQWYFLLLWTLHSYMMITIFFFFLRLWTVLCWVLHSFFLLLRTVLR